MTVSDRALPWVLLACCVLAGSIGGLIAAIVEHYARHATAWLAGRLSGLPILTTPFGCDDCSARDGEPHRYAGCPGNVRQHEKELTR